MKHPIDIALQIATQAHEGQKDKDGYPYILHPITVGMMGDTDEEKMAGFLHDVVEDTPWTFDQLLDAGIPDGVVNALRLLTHDDGEPYMDYVQRIIDSHNPIALQAKYNDLKHNFARGKAYPKLQAKHGPALELVEKVVKERSKVVKVNAKEGVATAIFACGCFWGVQHLIARQKGVINTIVGYTGGEEQHPSYADVRQHRTHHVEAVWVEYDDDVISYTDLCKLFFEMHDPAQVDGVGPDLGPQYRSCIFYSTPQQLDDANAVIQILRDKGYEVNTLLLPAGDFWAAEEYHQDYYELTGGSPYCHLRVKKF